MYKGHFGFLPPDPTKDVDKAKPKLRAYATFSKKHFVDLFFYKNGQPLIEEDIRYRISMFNFTDIQYPSQISNVVLTECPATNKMVFTFDFERKS